MRLTIAAGCLIVAASIAASCSGKSGADDAVVTSTGNATTSVAEVPATGAALPDEGTAEDEPRWATGSSEVLFDQDQLHTFEIALAPEALAELDARPAAEEYVEGSLTFAGETIEPVGVRYKGSVGGFLGCASGTNPFVPDGPKTCTKLSLKIKLNWSDPTLEFYGVRSLQFHAQNLDPSALHERLGYWLFREMGVPAPRSTHARVVVNGEYVGVFGLTEVVDGRFARENFEDGTGNLYKETWPFDADGAPQTEKRLLDGLETNEDEQPSVEIIAGFATEFAAAPSEQRLGVLERWTDVDLLLRTFVVDRAIKNDDGALHWYCIPDCAPHNFFWYEEPTLRRLVFIPWDLDNAFSALTPGSPVGGFIGIADEWGEAPRSCEQFTFGSMDLPQRSAGCDPLISALGSLGARFDEIRADFLAGPFAEERTTALLDDWSAQIEPAVAEAAAAHDDAPSVERWRAAVTELKDALVVSRAGNGR